jgi:hypothetical protein
MKRLLAAALFAGACLAVQAQPSRPVVMFGSTDCGSWVASPDGSRKAWVLGYLSGLSSMDAERHDVLQSVDSAQQIWLWVTNWCQANPLKTVPQAANALYLELKVTH